MVPFFSHPDTLHDVVRALRTWVPDRAWTQIQIDLEIYYPHGFMVRKIGRLTKADSVSPLITVTNRA